MVTFPDIPEAISYGETKAEAIDMAYDCLHCFKNVSYVDGIYATLTPHQGLRQEKSRYMSG